MIIKNEFNHSIYWRTFKNDDLFHVVGLSDGWLGQGQHLDVTENNMPSFQLEIKLGGPLSVVALLPAAVGLQYQNGDRSVVVTSTGVVTRG